MATIVNNPNGDGNRSNGVLIAVVAVLAFLFIVFFVFPAVFGDDANDTVVPQQETGNMNSGMNANDGNDDQNPSALPPIINNTTFNSTTTINTSTTSEDN